MKNRRFYSIQFCCWANVNCFIRLWIFHILLLGLVAVQKCICINNNINDIESALAQEGCLNYKDASFVASRVVACRGSWYGHISNASHLCTNGFSLCTWQDDNYFKEIRWSTATQLDGCYAFNAAQDGNKCIPCKSDVGSDDLAGIGKHCPHINFGQSACMGEGRIDASCCVETLNKRACSYIPNVINGVLCCQRNNIVNDGPYYTETIISPPVHIVHFVGERLTLKCPLVSSKSVQQVIWLKDEHLLPHVHSFTWTIPFVQVSDSGLYACRVGPSNAIAVSHINLTVSPVENSACADGTSEGFHEAQNVRGCAGSWKGHIKRADRQLCGKGWRVCVPKDRPFIQQIDLTYITDFGGCFAYNAAHVKHKCRRCQNKFSMAALGRDCPVNEKFVHNSKRPRRHSCYENRIMQIYAKKFVLQNGGGGCMYRKDHQITGVLCCRKPKPKNMFALKHRSANENAQVEEVLNCYPTCRNGGTCFNGQCLCPKGYFGHACQHGGCNPRCVNGGMCLYGFCKCDLPFHGQICQHNIPVTLNDNATAEDSSLHNQISDLFFK